MNTSIDIHPSEQQISRMARAGASQDAHLSACPRCRAIFDFYESYFAEERTQLARPTAQHDLDRIRGILSPGVYSFVPYRAQLNVSSAPSHQGSYVLAARHGAGNQDRYQCIASFAAETIKTVIRVLSDGKTGLTYLHVLSDDRLFFRHVELAVSDQLGHIARIHTDEDGVGILRENEQIDWKTARILLVTPQEP